MKWFTFIKEKRYLKEIFNSSKKKKDRIVTIPCSLADELDDLDEYQQEQMGNQVILRVKDEKSAYKIIRKCMNEKDASFRCEMVSLQMIIKEALYERTHSLLDS